LTPLPRGLGAHDFGLKDLFAAAALLGRMPELHLYTIAVEEIRPMCMELSPAVAGAMRPVIDTVRALAARIAAILGAKTNLSPEKASFACSLPSAAQLAFGSSGMIALANQTFSHVPLSLTRTDLIP